MACLLLGEVAYSGIAPQNPRLLKVLATLAKIINVCDTFFYLMIFAKVDEVVEGIWMESWSNGGLWGMGWQFPEG